MNTRMLPNLFFNVLIWKETFTKTLKKLKKLSFELKINFSSFGHIESFIFLFISPILSIPVQKTSKLSKSPLKGTRVPNKKNHEWEFSDADKKVGRNKTKLFNNSFAGCFLLLLAFIFILNTHEIWVAVFLSVYELLGKN